MTITRPYSPAINVMIDSFDGGDPWGSAMSMAFAVADVCEAAGLTFARDVLDYRPSPYVATPELEELCDDSDDRDVSFDTFLLATAYRAGEVDDDDLQRAARVLNRYLDMCKRAGLDY